jgi:hypothetical protein
MPKSARLYVAAVACAAAAVAAAVLPGTRWDQVNLVLFVALAALQAVIVLTSDFPRYGESPGVAAAVAIQLAGVVLLKPGPAAVCFTLGALCLVLRPGTPRDRSLFVVGGVVLTSAAGGEVYGALHGSRTLLPSEMPHMLLPIVAAALALSAVPAVLIGLRLVIGGRVRAKAAVRDAVRLVIPRNLAYSFVGLLAAVLWRDHAEVMAALVVLGPLVVTRWAAGQYAEQRAAHDATVRALVQAVEIKDLYTRGHSERVAKASKMIARRLGLDEDRIAILSYAAILHDVGKLGVPTRLLQKDGQFDAAELEAIRVHPVRGVDVVRDIAFLDEAYTAILHHHERMDGRGYPTGLAGEAIPKFARIIAVADAFDSMTSTRSYRPARPVPDALVELRNCAGSQFDPAMVAAMQEAIAEAEREGRPWLGDGTGSVPADSGSPALNADEYDHDDPAFSVPPALPDQRRAAAANGGPANRSSVNGSTVNGGSVKRSPVNGGTGDGSPGDEGAPPPGRTVRQGRG